MRDLGEEYSLPSYLINGSQDIEIEWLEDVRNIGITAGASAPEILVQGVIDKIKEISSENIDVRGMGGIVENTQFALPRKVRK